MRTESAALLAWFLAAVWRMDADEVEDAICDGGGDKGIDALHVDDDLLEITIFQSKHHKKAGADQGDSDLKKLVGAGAVFDSPPSVDQLMRSGPNPELLKLLTRLDVKEKVAAGAHATRLVFVTNGTLDRAGRDYVKNVAGLVPSLDVWDLPRLEAVAERTKRPRLRPDRVKLKTETAPTHLAVAKGVEIAVGLVRASELVTLPGITDLSLFDRNVRLSLGRTRINRELTETVRSEEEHQFFPAYHNGLTVLTNKLKVGSSSVILDGISVVNGCQSLLALHKDRASISPDLRVLVKVVQVGSQSDLSDKITYRANNQNPVDIRDQRSTDSIQRDLQEQVRKLYGTKLAYRIRDGEKLPGVPVLDNRLAAQLLMAIYVQEPWNAVRRVRLFDQDYLRIFNKDVDAPRLLLMHTLQGVLEDVRDELRPELQSSFSSVRLTLAYLIATVLRENDIGRRLLNEPERWLPHKQPATQKALTRIASEVVDSVNFFLKKELEEAEEKKKTYDPKTVFKSRKGVTDVEREVKRDAKRHAERDSAFLFQVRPAKTT